MRTLVAPLLVVLLCSSVFGRNISFDDLYSLPRASDPRISPDASQIVYALRETDLTSNSRQQHLWIMNADGSDARQLTFGPSSESHPRWRANGTDILFLADRGDGDQVWLLPMDARFLNPCFTIQRKCRRIWSLKRCFH